MTAWTPIGFRADSTRKRTGLRSDSARPQFSLARAPARPRPVPAPPIPYLRGGGMSPDEGDSLSSATFQVIEGDAGEAA